MKVGWEQNRHTVGGVKRKEKKGDRQREGGKGDGSGIRRTRQIEEADTVESRSQSDKYVPIEPECLVQSDIPQPLTFLMPYRAISRDLCLRPSSIFRYFHPAPHPLSPIFFTSSTLLSSSLRKTLQNFEGAVPRRPIGAKTLHEIRRKAARNESKQPTFQLFLTSILYFTVSPFLALLTASRSYLPCFLLSRIRNESKNTIESKRSNAFKQIRELSAFL